MNETVQFAKKWVNLETVIQDEVSQKEKNNYIISLICGIQKNDTNELIHKAETEIQRQRINVWMPSRKGGGVNWETGTDIHTLLCVKQISRKNLLYIIGNCAQGSVVT